MRRIPAIALSVLLVPGCLLDSSSTRGASESGEDGNGGGEFDRDDCKVEDGDIGVQGVALDLGTKSVAFESWIPKDDSPGEFVGFTLSLSGGDSIGYLVKTGGEVYAGVGTSWSHPNGTSGDQVPAISNVDFCDEVDDGGDGDGGDGDGDGDCEPDVDTGECEDGSGSGGDGSGDGGDGSGDGGDGSGGDGDCEPDVDTGECDDGSGGVDDGNGGVD
jgi:hypothetical protein